MSWEVSVTILSVILAVISALIAWKSYRLSVTAQTENFEQWLAVHEPWLRISFEHDTDEQMKGCFMRGYPAFIRLQNQGKLPCQVIEVRLGNELLKGRLRKSSISDNSIGGTLEGARLAAGETLYFRIAAMEGLIKRIVSNGESVGTRVKNVVPLEITFRYQPGRKRSIKADVKLVASKKWTLLRVIDSTIVTVTK
jgi:hypothetical protein